MLAVQLCDHVICSFKKRHVRKCIQSPKLCYCFHSNSPLKVEIDVYPLNFSAEMGGELSSWVSRRNQTIWHCIIWQLIVKNDDRYYRSTVKWLKQDILILIALEIIYRIQKVNKQFQVKHESSVLYFSYSEMW